MNDFRNIFGKTLNTVDKTKNYIVLISREDAG